jgi:CRISPR/Cas system CSM-associated protein Csm3 (group 7 of RAMP superfamily)
MAAKIEMNLTIVAQTAVSVGAGGSAGTLADKSIVRDGWQRPIIPGSQLKGKVRHAAEAMLNSLGFVHLQQYFDDDESQSNVIRTIFGSPRCRSPLFFADLVGVVGTIEQLSALREQEEQHQSQIRPSVAINRQRGVADDARLLFQETTVEGIRFHAAPAIMGTLPGAGHVALLWAALRLMPRWGSASSRGLGWVHVDVTTRYAGETMSEEQLQAALRDLDARKGEPDQHA